MMASISRFRRPSVMNSKGGMRRPSSNTSRVSADHSVPPMSAMRAMLPVQPISLPSANTGATMVISGRWPEVSHGSLQIPTSPSRHSAAGRMDRKCASVRDSVILNEGMPMVFSAIARPAASKITQAKSLDSRTVGENEVRRSVAAASSAMAIRRRQITGSAIGSRAMFAAADAVMRITLRSRLVGGQPARQHAADGDEQQQKGRLRQCHDGDKAGRSALPEIEHCERKHLGGGGIKEQGGGKLPERQHKQQDHAGENAGPGQGNDNPSQRREQASPAEARALFQLGMDLHQG